MSAGKHTPGPWQAVAWMCHAPTTVRAGNVTIAECGGQGRLVVDCEADARLIAAAPCLLEALRKFESIATDEWEHYPENANGKQWLLEARALIYKATGETQ